MLRTGVCKEPCGNCEIAGVWQAKRDNSSVYFQHVPPSDSLPAIEPKRLVTATPYALPLPAMLVTEALLDAFTEVPAEKVSLAAPSPSSHQQHHTCLTNCMCV